MANSQQPKANSLSFMMGEFQADFPTDRLYAKNHLWAQELASGNYRFGFGAYAVRLLQDVYFLDWEVEAGATLAERQEIGQIESQKAEASLYAPLAGELSLINDVLLSDPSTINVDKYGDGWLFEMIGDGSALLSPADYIVHLEAVWEVTQRTIKGQMNE
ncbi:glycine cleavage system protein H [Adhaeretor mobilis]|uniref:Glycine cleavage system H protein n=1 Tax=Adhaeretor mobilis TaxID=1930276 RepID=A0A517N015_9BACT|nr:glycine cleavage system protein H [Adhaeretor mobilis]QDT00477.1 Glycine cleavage system H protein [Adhaeretor mobilis]